MGRFLRETRELFYWAMFCPSRLQQRMNEWSPAEEKDGQIPNTNPWDILLFRFHLRFVIQYLILLLCFSLPLILIIVAQGQALNWLQLPIILVTAYSVGVWFLPIGLQVPLIWFIVYLEQPKSWIKGFNLVLESLIHLSQLSTLNWFFLSLLTGLLLLISLSMSYGEYWLKAYDDLAKVAGIIACVVVFVVAFIAAIFVIGNSGLTWWLTFCAAYLVTLIMVGEELDKGQLSRFISGVFVFIPLEVASVVLGGFLEGGVKFAVAFVVAEFVALVIARFIAELVMFALISIVLGIILGIVLGVFVGVLLGGVLGIVVGVVAGEITSTLYLFILICSLIAFGLAPAERKWLEILMAGILSVIGVINFGLKSLVTIPVVLAVYHRLLPDYLLLTSISLLPSVPLIRSFRFEPLQIIRLLPPYTSELLWLPLPNHDRILAAVFRIDTSVAMKTFKQMQKSSLPGFQRTIKQALPKIVADQLATIETTPQLISTAKPEHSILPLLVPTFYQLEHSTKPKSSPFIKTEIPVVLHPLQDIARDVEYTLETGNAALRERGLERITNRLVRLQLQLPGLGLKPREVKRWQPVIQRWQQVIELEIAEQQKQSQGELLNPFQYGNPVRLNQRDLFKGRQAFADDIVRLILNRNRPKLILHGPRRCGKTSFLNNLPRLLPNDVLPVFLNMQSAATTTSEADFCRSLVRAIYKNCRSQGVQLPTIPKRDEFQNSPYTTLEDWLDEALPQLEDKQLLLNFDEFEKIGTAIEQGRMTMQLFDELRHLIQNYEQLGFLFSGVQTLEEIGPNWSSYFISVVPIEMLYLEPKEAEELLLNPDPDFTLRYDTGIVEEVLKLTSCNPYLLQLLGAAMVTQANLNQTDIITLELLQTAIQDALTLGQPYFTNVWTEFTGTNPPEVAAGQKLLLAIAQGKQIVVGDETSQAALRRLLRYHIIKQTGSNYIFEVPLFQTWVRARSVGLD